MAVKTEKKRDEIGFEILDEDLDLYLWDSAVRFHGCNCATLEREISAYS